MLSGLRTGEQRQLTWSDISWDEHKNEENEISLINLKVRAETSKTRNSRDFLIKDKGYLEDYRSKIWDKHFANGIAKSYIFSADGKASVSKRSISYHFNKILELADIDTNKRDLVPYSFRHYFITHKVLSGLSYGEIANMCGTSAAHAEKTYFHISKAMKLTNALADYTIKKDGTIAKN
jgi:integrase